MAKVTMELIKELRERTAAGVVDCKNILAETDGDVEKAIEELQKRGMAKAAKKSGRIAAEGKIGLAAAAGGKSCALVEVNCETDFVAKGEKFVALCADLADQVLADAPADLDSLNSSPFKGDAATTVAQAIINLSAATGERITLRRFERFEVADGCVGSYVHDGGRICVMVEVLGQDGGSDEFAQMAEDVAMHIAAMNPSYVQSSDIPSADIEKQREIFTAQVIDEGKPEHIAPKIVEGKLAKWKKENCLVDQVFVKDSDLTISALLAKFGDDVSIAKFVRYEVGEGMEKRVNDLAAEVAEMTQ